MKSAHLARTVVACGVALFAAACSTTQTFVDYSSTALYSTETVGNVPYVEVGPASASQRGFFWEDCATMAGQAVTKLNAAGQQHGATAVSSVRWLNHADGTYTEKPICTTGWGWLLAPPVIGAFFPWVKATEVQGRLVGADETALVRLRGDVAKRTAAWQADDAKRQAVASMNDEQRAAQDKAAADKAAADKAAAEKVAADKAAAEKAAADKAALDRELEAKIAAAQAAADKAEADKAAAARKKKAVVKK